MSRAEPASDATRTSAPHPVDAGAATEAAAPTRARGSRRRFVLGGIGIVALAALGWTGWTWATVWRHEVSTDDAYVQADTAVIAAQATGRVLRVAVQENAHVDAGAVLAEIDPGDYRLAVAAADGRIATQKATLDRIAAQTEAQKATIAQAEAQLASAHADVERTEADLQRALDLVKTSAGTQQRVEQARADRDRTRAAVAIAEAGVAAAKGGLAVLQAQSREAEQTLAELATAADKARRDLSFTQVVAPFAGVVGNRAVEVGQYVQPGTRLLALVPLDTAYVDANLKETQLARVKPGEKAEVSIDALGSRVIEGRVVSIAPATGAQFSLLPPENATGNFTKIVQRVPVRIALPREALAEGGIRPGLSAVVTIDTREGER